MKYVSSKGNEHIGCIQQNAEESPCIHHALHIYPKCPEVRDETKNHFCLSIANLRIMSSKNLKSLTVLLLQPQFFITLEMFFHTSLTWIMIIMVKSRYSCLLGKHCKREIIVHTSPRSWFSISQMYPFLFLFEQQTKNRLRVYSMLSFYYLIVVIHYILNPLANWQFDPAMTWVWKIHFHYKLVIF